MKKIVVLLIIFFGIVKAYEANCVVDGTPNAKSKIVVKNGNFKRYKLGEILADRNYMGMTPSGRFYVYGLDFKYGNSFSIIQIGKFKDDGTFDLYRARYHNNKMQGVEWKETCQIIKQ